MDEVNRSDAARSGDDMPYTLHLYACRWSLDRRAQTGPGAVVLATVCIQLLSSPDGK
jgi:hypothetical protein